VDGIVASGIARGCDSEVLRIAAARCMILGSDGSPGGIEPNWYGLKPAMFVAVVLVQVSVREINVSKIK
jgi:hypothetical protein